MWRARASETRLARGETAARPDAAACTNNRLGTIRATRIGMIHRRPKPAWRVVPTSAALGFSNSSRIRLRGNGTVGVARKSFFHNGLQYYWVRLAPAVFRRPGFSNQEDGCHNGTWPPDSLPIFSRLRRLGLVWRRGGVDHQVSGFSQTRPGQACAWPSAERRPLIASGGWVPLEKRLVKERWPAGSRRACTVPAG